MSGEAEPQCATGHSTVRGAPDIVSQRQPELICEAVRRPDPPKQIIRDLQRGTPNMSMRLFYLPGFRTGSARPATATVEWAGRAGHPSSYGLLGGAPASVPRWALVEADASFRGSLAAEADEVHWGLPDEYERAVWETLVDQPVSAAITHAAAGAVGSSPHVFQALTIMLCRVLGGDLPCDDNDVWRMWDRCWNERR